MSSAELEESHNEVSVPADQVCMGRVALITTMGGSISSPHISMGAQHVAGHCTRRPPCARRAGHYPAAGSPWLSSRCPLLPQRDGCVCHPPGCSAGVLSCASPGWGHAVLLVK